VAADAPRGDVNAFIAAEKVRFDRESKGDIAIAVIERGHVVGEYFASHGHPVDRQSLFQVASMSKWFTAWGVMALVERGKLDLDTPVSHYLKRWKLPPSKFDNDGVTLRRLLSHTAGLTDGLGYRGFAPGQKVQTLPQSLTHAADAMPFAPGSARVGRAPGSGWQYSGGGYTLMQLVIEDVTGKSFNDYMRETVLLPLGMTQSTFVNPDPSHLADNFDDNGKPATRYTFTALAPASLYTSTADLTRFLQAQIKGPNDEPAGRGVLKPATLQLMRYPQATLYGFPIWGLGNVLYVGNNAGGFIVGHDGNNYPAINTTARIDPATGDGIIVLESGNSQVATHIGGDWDYWHTGAVDLVTIVLDAGQTAIIFAIGAFLILIAAGVIGWRGRRNALSAAA
jgi:CubicO group peptidase (beta-lactamase class C family)